MAKTKIEWCDYTINPIIGCKHGCPYCYAKRMNNRFHFIKKWDEPEHKEQSAIEKLSEIKKPSRIFMGSMTDLFGSWVTDEYIKTMLKTCGDNFPQHKFLFLTKNPKRYSDFKFPENCWKGTTITRADCFTYTELEVEYFHGLDFISFEPLMGEIQVMPAGVKWWIVGGLTGAKAPHKKEWVDTLVTSAKLLNIPIFLKDNLHYKKVVKQFPVELGRLREK